jgi:hypothetical protein
MHMTKLTILITVLLAAAVLFIATAGRRRHNEMSESKAEGTGAAPAETATPADCNEYLTHNPSLLPAKLVESERKDLSRSDFPTLKVEGRQFDAISVNGWERPDIQLTICKVAAAANKERATDILKRVTVEAGGGRLSSRGPAITSSVFVQNAKVTGDAKFKTSGDEAFWLVHYFLRVPRDLELSLDAESGDIRLEGLSGRVRARSENGGINLSGVGGSVEARSENGGISMSGGWGDVRLRSDNGGIDIRLDEAQWRGGALEAGAENGGLTVEVPPRFSSSIEAVTSEHGSLRCDLEGCGPARQEGGRLRLRVGEAEPAVRVSTDNGELHITRSR